MQCPRHLAIEGDASGNAQIAAPGGAQRDASQVQRCRLEALLHRIGEVTMMLCNLFVGGAWRADAIGHAVAKEPAVVRRP